MRCVNCGAEKGIKAKFIFCPHCGSSLQDSKALGERMGDFEKRLAGLEGALRAQSDELAEKVEKKIFESVLRNYVPISSDDAAS